MDFGLSNDDVLFVWELINHVMSCTITSTEKKIIDMFECLEESKQEFC